MIKFVENANLELNAQAGLKFRWILDFGELQIKQI